ncbi:C40 family peptidase [Mucilaginibacter psychrotolerans]|uniref:NlpC/P60 family protein n=1 Tax=Mucilaginibacter psychrotolerans TaxID=1524096 RepID=A0A4Y8SM04_9SPHI|nr:C40 family peptidase [Mucilaginibacter psychrotolerans]TFF39715.1 NlpC/P60 family protein [Mucilaginibacter psychrotolerans]
MCSIDVKWNALYGLMVLCTLACNGPKEPTYVITSNGDKVAVTQQGTLPLPTADSAGYITRVVTGQTTPLELATFARSLTGVPYKYASVDPAEGFDCSGFITYVFNHFGIAVPRTSEAFTYMHRQIDLKDAQTGDLVLFTGTDSTIRVVGHMGIILKEPRQTLRFIHSTSGHNNLGVTETELNSYYQGRYVKTVRVFER